MKQSGNKFGARKVEIDGHAFDSQGEGARYRELTLMQRAGEISGLTLKPMFVLIPRQKRGKRFLSQVKFTPDFTYTERGVTVVEDFKGMRETSDFVLRKKLFMQQHPDVLFRVTRRGEKNDEWMPETTKEEAQ